jgi:hypothetical protein
MANVKFTKDFADKKKGEVWECDDMLASHLIRVDEVAELVEGQDEVKPKKEPKTK